MNPVNASVDAPGPDRLRQATDRRSFLKWSGAAAATTVLVACDRTPSDPSPGTELSATAAARGAVTIDLGNDIGILNFAFALEQLEAAFYITAVTNPYGNATPEEMKILRSIKRHEVVHREFFRTALAGAAIPNLQVDFSAVDFGSRNSVLGTAQAFEDLGVGAYNGAGQFLRNGDYLVAAGKIVSVEARHASAIRDVLGKSFAPNAFDPAFTFEQVLRRAAAFIATPVTLSNSPTASASASTQGEEMVS